MLHLAHTRWFLTMLITVWIKEMSPAPAILDGQDHPYRTIPTALIYIPTQTLDDSSSWASGIVLHHISVEAIQIKLLSVEQKDKWAQKPLTSTSTTSSATATPTKSGGFALNLSKDIFYVLGTLQILWLYLQWPTCNSRRFVVTFFPTVGDTFSSLAALGGSDVR
jgi:hypothetical protein